MSNMVEVKTAELTGPALDWAVAKTQDRVWPVVIGRKVYHDTDWEHILYAPSTQWMHGGPLRDKHKVDITEGDHYISASILTESCECVDASGPTALVALCRAIVAAKLGDVVQVPAELVGGGE